MSMRHLRNPNHYCGNCKPTFKEQLICSVLGIAPLVWIGYLIWSEIK